MKYRLLNRLRHLAKAAALNLLAAIVFIFAFALATAAAIGIAHLMFPNPKLMPLWGYLPPIIAAAVIFFAVSIPGIYAIPSLRRAYTEV